MLSGDVHVSLALELHRRPFDVPTSRWQWSSSRPASPRRTSTTRWAGRATHDGSCAIEQRAVEILPHWQWADLDSHGYVIVDVDRDRVVAEWWHLGTVLEPSTDEELGARFCVRHGTRALERLEPPG